MLKRRGERCEFKVPEYSGRLTASERTAYAEAMDSIEKQLRQLGETATAMAEIEKQMPQWREWMTNGSEERVQSVDRQGPPGAPWQIRHTLLKGSRTELLFCSRESEQGPEFGILERTKPGLPSSQASAACEVRLVGNDARLLLQDYVDNQRRGLHACKKDIEALVERTLSEKFPHQNLCQVVKAISQVCDRQIVPGEQNGPAQTVRRGAKMRL